MNEEPIVPKPGMPSVTAMPEQPNSVSESALPQKSGKGKIILVVVLILVLLGGGYTAAASYFKVWPFGATGFLVKEKAFAELFSKMQSLESATYEAEFQATTEPREAGVMAFEPADFPEFEAEEQMYKREENKIRDINRLQQRLQTFKKQNPSEPYPTDIRDHPFFINMNAAAYQYTAKPDTDDYALTVTFETDAVLKQFQSSATQGLAQISGKTVTLSKGSGSYFYFYGEPARPSWVSALEKNDNNLFDFAPAEFALNLRMGGTSQKNADEAADGNFHIGGDLAMGDLSVAADIELRKKGDVYYGMITKFPSLFFDLSTVKNKWVKVTPDDLVGYNDFSFITSYVGKREEKQKNILEQLQTVFKIMDEEKVLVVDFSLADEMVGTEAAYAYAVSYDETRVIAWYERLAKELKEKYGDDAIIKLDEASLKYMKTDSFQKYLAYVKANTTIHILVNKQTGFLEKITYRFRFIPNADSIKFKDKQITLSLSMALSEINNPVKVEEPGEFITFEDAQIALTGQTKEHYLITKQRQNVEAMRSALRSYQQYTGEYPDTLDALKTPRGQLQKKAAPVIQNNVRLDFPDEFADFGSSQADYETTLAERPFLKVIPNDAYSKQPYSYTKTNDTEQYRIQYTMTIPTRQKKSSGNEQGFSYYSRFNINDAVFFVNGVNTATVSTLSIEARGALQTDSDNDGLPDIVETYYGSNLNMADSDGDGYNDGDEVKNGYDPAGPGQLDYDDRWYKGMYGPMPVPLSSTNASAKGTMSSILPGMVLCQDGKDTIEDGKGAACTGKETPLSGGLLCGKSTQGKGIGSWPKLPADFAYGTCVGDTDARTFSYKATNGTCAIECTEKGCTYTGC